MSPHCTLVPVSSDKHGYNNKWLVSWAGYRRIFKRKKSVTICLLKNERQTSILKWSTVPLTSKLLTHAGFAQWKPIVQIWYKWGYRVQMNIPQNHNINTLYIKKILSGFVVKIFSVWTDLKIKIKKLHYYPRLNGLWW